MPTTVKKRSVVVAGHRTSVSLERAFWEALRDLARLQGKTINQLVSEIDTGRAGNLSSSIRTHLLTHARAGDLAFPADGAGASIVMPERAAATAAAE